MPKYKTAKPEKEITLEEMNTWTNLIQDPEIKALLICLWIYGLRITEALRLRREDFSKIDDGLQVRAITLKRGKTIHRILWAKNDTPHIQQLISYVFSLDQMSKVFNMHRWTAWKKFKKLDEALCPHRFRHNRATKFAIARATPYELQNWLGHTDVRMSSEYIHASGIIARDLGKRVEIN